MIERTMEGAFSGTTNVLFPDLSVFSKNSHSLYTMTCVNFYSFKNF